MKVTFVYPDIMTYRQWSGYYYVGIASLASVLKQQGHKVSLIHLIEAIEKEKFISLVLKERPDLLAFSATTNQFYFARRWASWIKEEVGIKTIIGGIHAILNPQEVIEGGHFDMVCAGEGEEALVELCNKMEGGQDIRNIQNIWVRHKGNIYQNPLRPLINDLDSLPFPDKDVFDYRNLELCKDGVGVFMASRGCPYNCSYCCNHALKNLYRGQEYTRFRSVDSILEEINQTRKKYAFINMIYFDDDTFILNQKWLKEFSRKYKERVNLPFSCNVRADLVNEDTVRLLKESRCDEALIGVESGNEFILNCVLNRNLSVSQIYKACAILHKYNIKVITYHMVGMPFEDPKKILDTVKLIASVEPHSYRSSIFYPYKKSQIYELCRKEGYLTDRAFTDYKTTTILSYPYLSRYQITFFFKSFRYLLRFYSFLNKHPNKFYNSIKLIFEFLFCSKWTSKKLCFLIVGLDRVRKFIIAVLHKRLASAAKRVIKLCKYTVLRTNYLFRDKLHSLNIEKLDDEEHIKQAMRWLCLAQDAKEDNGLSKAYHLLTGWLPSYPEVTGYTIPTFFDYYQYTEDIEYRKRAIRMADWLVSIQHEDGSFNGGAIGQGYGPVVFDVGQIIFGFYRAYRETKNSNYLKAAIKSGEWLVKIQDKDGKWSRYEFLNTIHAYNVRVAWALLGLYKITLNKKYLTAAVKNVEWTIEQQEENGWFRNNSFDGSKINLTHTIAYTIGGILECGIYLNKSEYIKSAEKTIRVLLHLQNHNGILYGEYDSNWKHRGRYRCLTGEAQIAIIYLRLFQLNKEYKYYCAAKKLIDLLKSNQYLKARNQNVRGAIPGSSPINGSYFPYAFPSWTMKFFIDATLMLYNSR